MTMRVEVKGVDKLRRVLEDAPKNISEGFDKAVHDVSDKILATARGLIKTRSGWLAGSGYVIQRGLVQYEVGFGASYAKFVHEGTRPHDIYPRMMGGVLRFEIGGQIVFARHVHHPGTWPQQFLGASVEYWKPELLRVVKENIASWLKWSSANG